MENVGTFFGHLEYITYIRTFWYILEPFGNLAESWNIFPFCYIVSRKIWQTLYLVCTMAVLSSFGAEERGFD
jgi:hypothetical protein